MTDDTAVTLHLFIRPGTPPGAAGPVVSQLAELFEFGLIGPGSRVWANLEVPGGMWILSDKSTFVRVVDVPVAGWVRLTRETAAWGRTHRATTESPRKLFSADELPMTLLDRDLITVALRNADPRRMRAVHTGAPQQMRDFEVVHGQMRAVDFKIGGFERKAPLKAPTERDTAHAVLRGIDLLTATEPPDAYGDIADNLDAFTVHIDVDEFERIRAVRQRAAQIAESVVDPIAYRVEQLGIVPTGREDDLAS
jgi:hypothetical protein